jgi:PAS domain S-box-containing protein
VAQSAVRRSAEALAEVGRLLACSLDPEEVGQRITGNLQSLLGAQSAAMYRLDPASRTLQAVGVSQTSDLAVEWRAVLEEGMGVTGLAVRERWPAAAPDVLADARISYDPSFRADLGRSSYRAVLAVPLCVQDRVIGALTVRDVTGRVFDDQARTLAQAFADLAALALETARLFALEHARREQIEAMAELQRTLVNTLDLTEAAERVVTTVLGLFGVRHSQLLELDRAKGILVCVAVAGQSDASRWLGHTMPIGSGLAGLVAAEGRPRCTPDLLADSEITLPEAVTQRVRQEGDGAAIAVPLIVDQDTLGVLVLRDVSGRVFTDDEALLLGAFADQAALALQNARHHAEVKRRQREAEVLAALAGAMNQSLEREAILQHVARGARELSAGDISVVALRDADSGEVTTRHVEGVRGDERQYLGRRIEPGKGIGGRVLETGHPFRTDDYAADSRISADYVRHAEREGLRAALAVPVRVDGEVDGLLYVGRRLPRPFTDHDERALAQLADHAAIAITNARLLAREQTARAAVEASARALRASEEEFRALVEGSIQGMYINVDWTIRFANPAMARIFGFSSPEELLGLDFATLIAPHEIEPLRTYREARLRGAAVPARCEFEARRRDGTPIWIENTVTLVSWKGALATLGTFVDISERRRMKAILVGERQVLEMIATGAPLGGVLNALCRGIESQFPGLLCSVLILDADGLRLRHGAAPSLPAEYVRAVDGLTIGDDVGSCGTAAYRKEAVIVSDIATDPRWAPFRHLALPHGLRACWSTPVIAADGTVLGTFAVYYLEPRCPTPAEQQVIERATHIVGIALERARSESALREREEQLRQSQKIEAVGKLAGGVAHDFNNMLTVIVGRAEVAQAKLGADHPSRRDVELIRTTAHRAAALTQQLLAFSRKQTLQPKSLDLSIVVNAMALMLRRMIGEDIELKVEHEPGLGRVKADPGQIEQVILNLVVNARDAMPTGGWLTLTTANVEWGEALARRHPGVRPGPYVRLDVHDTGCGMDASTRAQIFEPFFTTKERGKGTGLGLATVYGIVKQHGGWIEVESEPERGSRFMIYLPRIEAAPDESSAEQPVAAAERGSGTIMLVEDDELVRGLTVETLEAVGYRVLGAGRPLTALRMFQQQPDAIDLLVTDVVMPEMSGRDLAEQLRASRPKIRVVFMSGYTGEAISKHGILDPTANFLQKPFTRDGLLQCVSAALHKSE